MSEPGMEALARPLGDLYRAGRAREARALLASVRRLDPAALGAEKLAAVGHFAGEETTDFAGRPPPPELISAWRLPEELGGEALLLSVSEPSRTTTVTALDREDRLILSYGGISAAVGMVPISIHRQPPDGPAHRAAVALVDSHYADYGPDDARGPEELREEAVALLQAVAEATGCEWIESEDLEKEEWDGEAVRRRYDELAEEHGLAALDPDRLSRESHWIRYGESVRHLTLQSYAKALFEADRRR